MSDDDNTSRKRALSREERAKVEAETAKIEEETRIAQERAEADQRRAEAEANKAEKEVAKPNLDIEILGMAKRANQINLDQLERQEEATLATDLFHQTYHFTDEVSEKSVKACIERLAYWHRVCKGKDGQPCNIEIIFTSPGGSVFDGLVLFDYIQELKRSHHEVTTASLGYAASMAGILLQAGSKRVMAKEAWLMIHEISTMAWGRSSMIEDEVAFVKRIQDRVINIFLDGHKRAVEAGTAKGKMNRKIFEQNWKRKDWWLTSEQALELGFVDAIR